MAYFESYSKRKYLTKLKAVHYILYTSYNLFRLFAKSIINEWLKPELLEWTG